VDAQARVLERGTITFLYRPVVVRADEAVPRPRDLSRVQRLYLLLEPERARCRLLVIGRKKLPDPAEPGHSRFWGFVDTAGGARASTLDSLQGYTYATRTRGLRRQPGARVAGEGVYALVRHDDHTHLEYELRGPEELGALQEALHIRPRASYIVVARNPAARTPPEVDVPREARVRLPACLEARFRQRRFAPADPELLDQEGLDLILISAAEEPYSLGTNSSAAEFMQ
jgi:hypothetical protein